MWIVCIVWLRTKLFISSLFFCVMWFLCRHKFWWMLRSMILIACLLSISRCTWRNSLISIIYPHFKYETTFFFFSSSLFTSFFFAKWLNTTTKKATYTKQRTDEWNVFRIVFLIVFPCWFLNVLLLLFPSIENI